MNFHHMPELDQPWAYPAMITLTVGICTVLYVVLKRAGWL
jgi:magnesium transporter